METSQKKDFDAVAWSRETKRRIFELLQDAEPEDVIAFFNEGKLTERMKAVQRQRQEGTNR